VRSASAISPVGLWSRAEAQYTVRSVGLARRTARAIDPVARLAVANRAGRTFLLGQVCARPWRVPASAAAAALRNMARAPGVEATRRELVAYRLEPFETEARLTIAWGDRDRLTPVRQALRARELFPRARHATLTGCGHVPMFDDPDQVTEALLM
jgi:pimeloyl-ACP methyl ester carboxylesterase